MRGAGALVKAIDILCNDIDSIEVFLEFDKRHVPRVWLSVVDNLAPVLIPLPDEVRVAHEGIDIRELFRLELRPDAIRRSKRRHTRFRRDARAR